MSKNCSRNSASRSTTEATTGFLLSALRDAEAAKHLFRKALGDTSHRQPRVINTKTAPTYGAGDAGIDPFNS